MKKTRNANEKLRMCRCTGLLGNVDASVSKSILILTVVALVSHLVSLLRQTLYIKSRRCGTLSGIDSRNKTGDCV